MSGLLFFACVSCTVAAVLTPFDTLGRINVVLAVANGLLFIRRCLEAKR